MTASDPGPAGSAGRDRRLTIVVPALIFVSGSIDFILYHDIGLLGPEALLAGGVVTGAGIVMGLILS